MSAVLSASAAVTIAGRLRIVNVCGSSFARSGTFTFKFFPTPPISHGRRSNWREQETTTGTQPLFYFNREAKTLQFPELWLDNTDTNESLTPTMLDVYALQDETCDGAPPPLIVTWGDRTERVILEEVHFDEEFHTPVGNPIRVKASLTFKQVQ